MDDDGLCLAISYNEEDLFRHLLLSIDKFFDIRAKFVIVSSVCALNIHYTYQKLYTNEIHAKQMN